MPSSVFTRPRARPPLAAVSSQQNLIAVSTEDEFRSALTVLPRSDGSCYGRGINIVSDISFKSPVLLKSQHSGLKITSSSASKVSASKPIGTLFSNAVNPASDVVIENLSVGSIGNPGSSPNIAFVVAAAKNIVLKNIYVESLSDIDTLFFHYGAGGESVRILDCFVDDATGVKNVSLWTQATNDVCSGARISGNTNFYGGIGVAIGGGIFFTACLNKSVISNNINLGKVDMSFTSASLLSGTIISSNVMADQIIIGAATQRFVVCSNSMNGSNINTSAGATNTIVGNSNVGTILNSATDAVTSNT